MSDDVPTALRELADLIEREREKVRELRTLLMQAEMKVSEWAGVNEEAYEWWVRANQFLKELDQ
jgi:hypothetical protein